MRFEYREKSQSIIDTWNGKIYAGGRVLCDLLNDLDEKWVDEFSLRETLQLELQRVEEENKQLKQENKLKGDFRGFISKDIQKIKEENEQLKQDNQRLIAQLSHIEYRFTEYRNKVGKND